MTTIAWDGTSLAADRQGTVGCLKTKCQKIFTLNDGRLYGAAGEYQDCLLVRDWLNGHEKQRPENVSEGFTAIVVALDGIVHRLEYKLILCQAEEEFYAIGSGCHYALTAMVLGKTAPEAVEIASDFDPDTGGGINVLRVGKASHRQLRTRRKK